MNDKEVFYPAINLYRVICAKKGATPHSCIGDGNSHRSAYVLAASVESASLKAEAHFNGKDGGEFEASSVDLYASGDSKDNVFIG